MAASLNSLLPYASAAGVIPSNQPSTQGNNIVADLGGGYNGLTGNVVPAASKPASGGGNNNSGGGSYQNGGWYMHNGQSMQYNNGNWSTTPMGSSSGGSNNSGGSSTPSINFDAIYNPIISNLQSLAGTLQGNETQDLGQVQTQQGQLNNVAQTQDTQLNTQNQGNYDTNSQSIQSAYNSALKQFQNLMQQYRTGFGAYDYGNANPQDSLTDYEVNQLNQEGAQTFGQLQNADQTNTDNFQNNQTSIGTWFAGAQQQIGQWYNTAYDTLQGQLQQGLASIQSDLSMAESDKAAAMMNYANEAAQQQMALQDYATQFSNELAVATQLSGNGTGGSVFAPMATNAMEANNSALQQVIQNSGQNIAQNTGVQNINQNLPQLGFVGMDQNNNNQSSALSAILNSIGQSQSAAANTNPYAGLT